MKEHRKFLAILLCMVMCFSLLPTWAFAEEEQAEDDIVVEEEPVTEELVVAEEPAEEDDLVIEEAADSFENTNRTGDDDTLLEELEAAIADENVHDFDLSNLGEFVISRDLDVYGGMALNTIGTTVVIPEGVTVTVRDYFGLENLQLDGEMTLEEGHVSVFWELVLNGQMTLIRSSADLPAEAFSDAVFDRVDLSEDGHISLQYAAQESEEEILSAIEAAQALPERYDGCVQVLFPWTLSRDLTLDEKVGLVLEGAWNQGSLEIPADTSLTVDSYLVSVGSPVRVHGMLVNNRELYLDADDGAENPSVGSLELDRGSYSGPGSIYVLSTENPEDYLQGLDLSAFESHIEDEIWTVYTNDNAVFEDFKKACSEASELNPIHYTRLSDRGAFTIPESITIPKGLSVDVWNTVITVPSGVTLTVCGEFTLGDLVVAEGGEVVLEEECNLWIDSSLALEGSFRIANNTWPGIPADSWDPSMTEHLTFGGRDAGIKLNIWAQSEEDIQSAPEQYPILPHVRPSIGVEFAWCLSGDFAFPEGVEIHIEGAQGGSLTVPSGLRFENGGGYLGLHWGATMTAAGTLVNNGFIDVQKEGNQASRIVLDGGAYEGDGEICVRGAADEEEAAGLLGGLTELGSFRVTEQEDGIYFQLREPDWTFAHLQEVCAEIYKEGEDNYREIPNEGPLTIEDNLTIPENLILNKPGGAIVVPEGKTLTIIGTLHCNGLVADGNIVLKDGGYLNVYGSQLEGKGTIAVQSDSHMDVNKEAWQGGEWGVEHLTFAGDRSYGTVWYDVWTVEDALAAVADTPALGDHMGRSLNTHFDWTLEEDLTIPNEMWVEIRGKDGAALTIPKGVTLTMNNALRVQGADVTVLGTLVNEGRLEVYWDDEHRRLGKVSIESGGKYAGEGDIWVDTLVNPADCLPGLNLSAYASHEEAGGTLYYLTNEVNVDPALNLHDTIGVRFYVIPSKGMDLTDVTVNVAYNSKYQKNISKDFKLADMKPNARGEYYINAVDCASDEMSDIATLTVKNGTAEIFRQEYSIASIAQGWLADEGYEHVWPLLKAMLQYGEKAQVQFGNNADKHITPEGAPALVPIPADYAPGADPTTLSNYIEYCQFGISLETAVGMNIYIKPKAGVGVNDVSVKVTEEDGKEHAVTAPALVSGEIKVSVPGLFPEELLTNFKITVTVKGVSAEYGRSVMSCAYGLQQRGLAVDLVQALYQYSLAAADFFG